MKQNDKFFMAFEEYEENFYFYFEQETGLDLRDKRERLDSFLVQSYIRGMSIRALVEIVFEEIDTLMK